MSETPVPPTEAAFFQTIRSWGIVRGDDGILGGVIAGLGWRINLAPWPSRLLVALASLLIGPLILVLYAAGWALLPDARGNIVIQNFGRGVTQVGPLVGIAILAVLGMLLMPHMGLGHSLFDGNGWLDLGPIARVFAIAMVVFVPLALVGAAVALVIFLARRQGASADAGAEPGSGGSAKPVPVYAITPQEARTAASLATPTATSASGDHAAPDAPTSDLPKPPPAPTPPPTPRPAPPRVPGPGRTFYLLGLAWLLLSLAGTAWAWREGMLGIWAPLAWGLLFITGWGVLLMLVSLSGRRQGFQGFVGTVGLLITVVLLWQAPAIVDHYRHPRPLPEYYPDYIPGYIPGWSPDHLPELTEPDTWVPEFEAAWDPTTAFTGSFETVVFNAFCSPADDQGYEAWQYDTTSRFSLGELSQNRTIEVTTSLATVTVASGTSIIISADDWVDATVIFADRSVSCAIYSTDGGMPYERIMAVNPDAPVLTVSIGADMSAHPTIVIEEN